MDENVTEVPMLDLRAQYATFRERVRPVIDEVCDSQRFILGPVVTDFENRIASYCGVKHAIGASSGSDALILSLMAAGIGRGDEVITSTFTFFATAGAIVRVGATPVFVDIDPATFNLQPEAVEVAVTDRTKAVVAVDLFGQLAPLERLAEIADRHDLTLVEDAAQSIGASRLGKKAGQFGGLCCFSFFPSKNLGGFGDGGMVVTDDDDLAHRCRILRNHGAEPKYYHKLVGGNFRLDALQAAVLNVKLDYLDGWSQARRDNAARYAALLGDLPVGLPRIAEGNTSIFNQYTIRVPGRRDELRGHLLDRHIGCEVYYPVPLHLQECFADLGGRPGDCPEAEAAAREVLSIPIYPELTDSQQAYVAEAIRDVFP